MEKLEGILYALDNALSTKKKRHIVGGFLLSVSMLFGGLAVTILTLKSEDKDEYEKIYIK